MMVLVYDITLPEKKRFKHNGLKEVIIRCNLGIHNFTT